jgi:hypothetical protein
VPDEARQDFCNFNGSAGWDFLCARLGELTLGAEGQALANPHQDEPCVRYYKIGFYNGVKEVARLLNNLIKE